MCHRLVSIATVLKKEMKSPLYRDAIFFLFLGSSTSHAGFCNFNMWEEETSAFLFLLIKFIAEVIAK
jgi:hypothetical protein